ncbi:MAG TPA: hypothetical protein VGL88_01910, partial [Pseudonocardiaceae bacterium]
DQEKLQKLMSFTESAGFAALPAQAKDGAVGWRYTVELEDGETVSPAGGDAPGDPVNKLTIETLFKGYTGGVGAAPSQLAVGTMMTTAGSNKYAEHIQLEAYQGNLDWMVERQVNDAGALVMVDGWWDRFRGCLGGCGGVCLAALGSCISAGALPAILGCLAIRCGGCAAKCAACATCDCSWLCRWAVGCCRG